MLTFSKLGHRSEKGRTSLSGVLDTFSFGKAVAVQAWPTFWLALICIGVVLIVMNLVLSTNYQRSFGEVLFKKGYVLACLVIFALCVAIPHGWEYLLHPVVDSGGFDSKEIDSPEKVLFFGDLVGSIIGLLAAFGASIGYQKTH